MFLLILKAFTFEQKIYCVKSNVSGTSKEPCNCQNYINWSTLISNSSEYFNSYTKICLLNGFFNLNTKLFISNVTNLSLIGSGSTKPTSIKCFNNSFVSISHTAFVELQNITLETCGANIESYVKIGDTYTAVLLHNVRSMTIYNVTFKNSNGHSIIGITLMEYSVLQKVSIFYVKDNGTSSKKKMGGIVLMFTDEITNFNEYDNQQTILIKQCHIFYMCNTEEVSGDNSLLGRSRKSMHSLALGIDLDQQKYSVNITIMNTSISNIKAQNGALIYILYNSSNTSSVTFLNSNISNNHIYGYSIIEITKDMGGCRHCKSISIFESIRCVLFNNTGRTIYFLNQIPSFPKIMVVHITVTLTVFTYNKPEDDFWKIKFKLSPEYTHPMINNSFKQCVFALNSNLNLEFYNAGNVTLLDKNLFTNNKLNLKQPKALVKCSNTVLSFQGYNEFSFNTAYWIVDLTSYVVLMEHAIINITQNIAVMPEVLENKTPALIHFIDNSNSHLCMFQFYSSLQKSSQTTSLYDTSADHFNIFFKDNTNYSSLIFGTQLNSCFWLNGTVNFENLTTGEVMKNVLHFNETGEQVVRRKVSTLCYCDNVTHEDCIEDHFGTIFPGQRIPVSLKQIPPYSKTSIYSLSQPLDQLHINVQQCPVESYQLNWLQSIDNSCTPIYYTVYSNYTTRCYISFKTTYPDDSLYIYYIDMHETCPCGFTIVNRSCECDPRLKEAFPTITCDVNTQTITRPGGSWIGLSVQCQILYAKNCAPTVCQKEPTNIYLNSSDNQCNFNRGGIACGQCPSGLSAILGSLRCKKCSNQWLLLIPVLLLVGLFIIFMLFTLNLTIVDGKINGFILYVNVIVANIHSVFLPSSNTAKLMSLINLDFAIETCFYDGMTEYDKTWLQFAFPLYLLFIVAILALASRYSSLVERLTRRRAIPVIATIFLFSYNKLLLVTAKVLYSYTTVYSLSDNKKTTVWMWDTSISIFGIKFGVLFLASFLLLIVTLLPLNFFLLFTKLSLRIRILAKYLKPYLDVFQAAFKDSCRHFPGLELLIRWISFAIGSRFLKSAHERLALDSSLYVFLLVYICAFKPFKSLTNTVLYISYVINVECIINLLIYSDEHITETYYTVIIHVLIFIALAEFGTTVLYYLYINHLQKIKQLQDFVTKINDIVIRYYSKYRVKPTRSPNIEPAASYDHFQEELLLADPIQ